MSTFRTSTAAFAGGFLSDACEYIGMGRRDSRGSSGSPGPPRAEVPREVPLTAAARDLGAVLSSSKQSRTHQLMPNIWRISDVRPIRAELTDPKETGFCSCGPHSSSPRSPLHLLPPPPSSSSSSSCQSKRPSRSGNIYFLFRCSSSDVGSWRVVFVRWEDN